MAHNERASIMVVDDQLATLKLLQARLGQEGYEVRLFPEGKLALADAACQRPDLILLDVCMPKMNGFDVCDRLRSNPALAHIPVIFLTASDRIEDKLLAFRSGATDYITKPFQFDEVKSRVKTHLKVYRLQQAQQRHADQLEELVRTRTHDLEESRIEILQRLAIAAEYRDDDTGKHTQRVGRVSALLARALGVSCAETELIRLAAPLHDIGKIGIPDHILLANRKLTRQEFNTIKTHVSIGSTILSGSESPLLQMAECIALYHHEHWDGAGYCAGLKGDAIPLPARIVAVADTFDALTHERPYKPAWPLDEAMAEIGRLNGSKFDPGVVAMFCTLVSNEVIVVDPIVNPSVGPSGGVPVGEADSQGRMPGSPSRAENRRPSSMRLPGTA
jgi:putative two-component system response regulator